jgi:glycosyltransferase involved in cell wall biosynthesis
LVVGVVLHTDVDALHGTLDALTDALHEGDRVVLVPDGPDVALAAALRSDPRLTALPQLTSAQPAGNAAAFNRLARELRADEAAVVFLENGARPAPDALDRLSGALERDGVGLAGPSTNDAWNDQRALPDGRSDPLGLRDGAARLAVFHGDEPRTLAPLYSLSEVCFAVAREVVTAVGAADEGFGVGPCWEMEYTARAARAGFDTVWVGAAYVYRAPPTRRRLVDDARHFAAAKRRYQDRLCGLRLDGSRTHHVDHCEGDACPHFAPPDRVLVHLPLTLVTGPTGPAARAVPAGRAVPAPRRRVPTPKGRAPFVSCVMVTADRADWARQAIAYFHRQTHPADARELIVVDDGAVDLRRELGDLLDHPAIVPVRLVRRESIGVKRNLGTARARGDVLMQWDDDDWYGPNRIARQAAPIAAGTADITGLCDAVWFDVDDWGFRRPSRAHHRHLFVEDVAGGTLAFHRRLWDRGLRYPDTSLAEDAAFVGQAVRRGARLARLPAEGVFVYLRHGTNSWQLRLRDDRAGWDTVSEPAELTAYPDDRAWYAARSRRAGPVVLGRGPGPETGAQHDGLGPTVSCIMPTADRLDLLPAAIEGFRAQTYRDAELVVVDDGAESAGHLVPDDPRVRYIRLDRKRVLGEKRNLAIEEARGEVIVHMDDDDWSHPERVAVQVAVLAGGDAELCGLAQVLWWDPHRQAAWRYTCPRVHRPWVAGNTLAYWRDAWRRAPFPAQGTGEDTAFVWAARRRVQVIDDERLVIGTLHARNTSPKRTHTSAWTSVDRRVILRIFAEAGAPVAVR